MAMEAQGGAGHEDALKLLVCDHLRREAAAALRLLGEGEVTVVSVPTACDAAHAAEGGHPAVSRWAAGRGGCCILGGPCLTRLKPAGGGAVACPADTCLHLVADPEQVTRWLAAGMHLVTPGWLSRWRAALDRWGLDQPTAQALFRETAREILLLDTGLDPGAEAELAAFAAWVGLPWSVARVGIGPFSQAVARALEQARAAAPAASAAQAPATAASRSPPEAALRRRLADAHAVLDFTARLAGRLQESAIVRELAELLETLFGAEAVVYLPLLTPAEADASLQLFPAGARVPLGAVDELRAAVGGRRAASWSSAQDGLFLRLGPPDAPLGLAGAFGVHVPADLREYVVLAEAVGSAAHLALSNARAFARVLAAEESVRRQRDQLEEAVELRTAELSASLAALRASEGQLKTLTGLLPVCASCKKLRDGSGDWTRLEEYLAERSEATFSHGICPDCLARAEAPEEPGRRRP